MRTSALVFLAALHVATLRASAQQWDPDLVRDSLKNNSSVPELRKREYALAARASRSTDALVERGLVLLRIYELTRDNDDADQARKSFEEALKHDPRSGWAHYGLGLALSGGPGVRVPSPGGVLDGFVLGQSLAELFGQDPRSRASRHFLKAVEFNPSFSDAAVEFARIALETRDRQALAQGRDVIRRMHTGGVNDPELSVALSNIEAALGNLDAALAAADAAIADSSTSSGHHARATALLRQKGKEEDGARSFFAAVDGLDAESMGAFFADVRTIANARELQNWERNGIEGRRALLKYFWEIRAAAAGVSVPERMAEHYRRIAEAQTRFRRTGRRGGPPAGSLISKHFDADALPYDERGLIYIRHGEPLEILRASNVDLRPNETWVYRTPTGAYQMFHFVVLRDGTDYRLVDDLFNAVDPSSNNMPYDGVGRLLESRAAYDQRYNVMAQRLASVRNRNWFGSALAVWAAAEGTLGGGADMGAEAQSALSSITDMRQRMSVELRETALAALESDTDRPDFAADLPFYYDLYTFRGRDNVAEVTAALAIPGTHLTARATDNRSVYSLGISFIVIDTVFGTVARKDTTVSFVAQALLGPNEHVRFHTSLVPPAGSSPVYRIVVRDLGHEGRGQLYGSTMRVGSYGSPNLAISDIVLAEAEPGSWTRGNVRLALVPPRQFTEKEPISFFYELYNLPEGSPYRTEIVLTPEDGLRGFTRIRRLFGGSDGSMRLTFDGTAQPNTETGAIQELRRVTVDLKPGRYKVNILVTSLQTQQTTTTEKRFQILER